VDVRGCGNGNKIVASTASEAFSRLLHNRNAPVELASTVCHIVSPRDTFLYRKSRIANSSSDDFRDSYVKYWNILLIRSLLFSETICA